MNVLVVGSGGREHAMVWKLRQSGAVQELYCAPGNAGIEQEATCVSITATDLDRLLAFAKERRIDLTVVGPEQPLALGIVDLFEDHGLRIFGPRKAAAMLEGSKAYAKDFMLRYGIPTAHYRIFSSGQHEEAEEFLRELSFPVVVKADGLAAGKGVVVCESLDQALGALAEMMLEKKFGSAGDRVVIEEYLNGEEASVFAITDGSDFFLLTPAQDHKRILDNDMGKNTGGMGAYAPAPLIDAELSERITNEVIRPTLEGMRKEGTPYRGCLYCGLMVTTSGPKLLEYNCRFGDPEAQAVIPLFDGDVARLLMLAAEGKLNANGARLHTGSAVCVVMASRGYPDEYETGNKISGLDAFRGRDDVVVFHAGTQKRGNDVMTSGGRVLGVTAIGFAQDIEVTVEEAYRAVETISFDGAQYRRDIGRRALRRAQLKIQDVK